MPLNYSLSVGWRGRRRGRERVLNSHSALCLPTGAHSGVSGDVLASRDSTANNPLPPAVHDSALTPQPSNTVRISTWREGLGRPRCTAAQGCPDTSPSKQSWTWALPACLLSALGSQGNPRQQTETLASNSRAPCSKDASFPYLLCYYVLSLRLFLVLVFWGFYWSLSFK